MLETSVDTNTSSPDWTSTGLVEIVVASKSAKPLTIISEKKICSPEPAYSNATQTLCSPTVNPDLTTCTSAVDSAGMSTVFAVINCDDDMPFQ